MRTLTCTALALAASALSLGAAQAQTVTNLNLDTWSTRTGHVTGGVEAPANWQTTDDLLSYFNNGAVLPSSTATVSKTTDVHGGSFAAKLENKAVNFIMGSPVIGGQMVLGAAVPSNALFSYGGAPFTGRPSQVNFYYKLTGASAATDSAYVFVELTTTNAAGVSTTIGLADSLINTPAATYRLFTLPISYAPGSTAPDSVHITISSGSAENLSTTTALYVDDFTLGTLTATRDAGLQAAVTVAPNPSAGGRFALNTTEAALLAAPLTVTDATGRVVLREAAARPATERLVDLSRQAAGLYTLQLQTEKGLVVHKLMVQ